MDYNDIRNIVIAKKIAGGGSPAPTPTYQQKSLTPDFSSGNVDVTADSGYDALSKVTVQKDSNLIAENIKKDVTVHGITGSYEGAVLSYDVVGNFSIDQYGNVQNYRCVANVPEGGKYLAERLFSGGIITRIVLPSTITSCGPNGSLSATNCTDLICKAVTPPSIQASTLTTLKADCNIYVPRESVDAYKSASYWSARADYIQAIEGSPYEET